MSKYSFDQIPDALITVAPINNLVLSICIPCYNEPDIGTTIQSLLDCQSANGFTEIIVLINESESASSDVQSQNQKSYIECNELIAVAKRSSINLFPIYMQKIPRKSAGVGFARRLAMDEANRRFDLLGKDRGVIICLDADTTVANDYLVKIEKFFIENLKKEGCSIAFEHKLDITDETIKSAICDYESHLRYFINMQRLINLPFAYQTVGSAMAVTAQAYQKLGGMNTRKAGEDFYFLHKFIKNDLVRELNTTCVYPSARVSDRVPFGTGKAVRDIITDQSNYQTYNPESFKIIGDFVISMKRLYQENTKDCFDSLDLEASLRSYLIKENSIVKIDEIKSNTSNYDSFRKRFFHWFNAFKLMKSLHYLRDEAYPNISVKDGMTYLHSKLGLKVSEDKYENLIALREFDRINAYELK